MLKFNHDGEKPSECHTDLDLDVLNEMMRDLLHDGHSIIGNKKTMTAEWISKNAEDPNIMFLAADLFVKGLIALQRELIEEGTLAVDKDVNEVAAMMREIEADLNGGSSNGEPN